MNNTYNEEIIDLIERTSMNEEYKVDPLDIKNATIIGKVRKDLVPLSCQLKAINDFVALGLLTELDERLALLESRIHDTWGYKLS